MLKKGHTMFSFWSSDKKNLRFYKTPSAHKYMSHNIFLYAIKH